jgi:hypothetical protein
VFFLLQGVAKGSACFGESEPLISGEDAHGEQSLLNLLITGTPSSHVFDGARDLGGMSLCCSHGMFASGLELHRAIKTNNWPTVA